jgi:hypothetical protein
MSILRALTVTRKPSPVTVGTGDEQITVCLRPVSHGVISGFSARIQGKEKDPEAQTAASGYLLHALVVDADGSPVFESAAHAATVLSAGALDGPMGDLQRKVMEHVTIAGNAATPKASPPTTDSVG